jgi:hypothetical protein
MAGPIDPTGAIDVTSAVPSRLLDLRRRWPEIGRWRSPSPASASCLARQPSAGSQVWRRAEDLDGVPRCGVAEGGRIDRAGIGQAAFGGGLADLGSEVFEAGWCRDL